MVAASREPGAAAGLGAYGIVLEGLEDESELLVPARPDWPRLRLATRVGRSALAAERVSGDVAELKLRNGGEIRIDRLAGRAEFVVPAPIGSAELVHPYLAPAAAVVARWAGRQPFHGGAFAVDGGVWALLGDREGGKSSTLAWLAAHDVPIVCDDMLICEDGRTFAGPRALDLRREPAERLGLGNYLGIVGARERWRHVLPPVEDGLPLRGFVFLDWSEELELAEVSPGDRLARLFTHAGLRLPPVHPQALLDLVELPAYELRRPQGWPSLDRAGELLLGALGAG